MPPLYISPHTAVGGIDKGRDLSGGLPTKQLRASVQIQSAPPVARGIDKCRDLSGG